MFWRYNLHILFSKSIIKYHNFSISNVYAPKRTKSKILLRKLKIEDYFNFLIVNFPLSPIRSSSSCICLSVDLKNSRARGTHWNNSLFDRVAATESRVSNGFVEVFPSNIVRMHRYDVCMVVKRGTCMLRCPISSKCSFCWIIFVLCY